LRAKKPKHLLAVFTPTEAKSIIAKIEATTHLNRAGTSLTQRRADDANLHARFEKQIVCQKSAR
jgi:hypothetical protein